jgi:hypothetical protein
MTVREEKGGRKYEKTRRAKHLVRLHHDMLDRRLLAYLGAHQIFEDALKGETYYAKRNHRRLSPLPKNHGEREQFLAKDAHEPIIEYKKIEQVQEEMERRGSIEIVNGKVKRKETHNSHSVRSRIEIN